MRRSSESAITYDVSGVGLFITKKIIELQEGSIDIKIELGNGSEFTVSLPESKGKEFG